LSESTLAQVCSAFRIPTPPIDSPKGVILSTAFVHLLQDAFDRLQDPQVKQYTSIGRWTGLIVQVQPHIGFTDKLMILTASPPCLLFSLLNVCIVILHPIASVV
jgi:hypothetical protein